MTMKLKKGEAEFIKSQNVGRVATTDNTGMPHNVPVCPILEKGKVYFATENDSKKLKNIKGNPKVAIVFDVYSNSWKSLRGVMLLSSGHCQ